MSDMHLIPMDMRRKVMDRDYERCRLCGRTDGVMVIHHIMYGGDVVGMGGRRYHHPDNLVTLGGYIGHDCHSVAHSNKKLWQPLLLQVVQEPPVITAAMLRRWNRS